MKFHSEQNVPKLHHMDVFKAGQSLEGLFNLKLKRGGVIMFISMHTSVLIKVDHYKNAKLALRC